MQKEELIERYKQLVKSVPTKSPIFLPTEKVPLDKRIEGLERVKKIYDCDLDRVYRPQLQALRQKYLTSGRCFIIGNGPSLNSTDLSVLKDEVTFAVNGFFMKTPELDWQPTFYVVEDHLVAEDRREWIDKIEGPTKLFPAYLAYCFDERSDTIFYNHRPRISYPDGFDFSTDASKITYTGCTVTYSCMQLAYYLGFKEIYLIGVDASYDIPQDVNNGADYEVGVLDMKSDDPNHFHPDYFGKGFRWHDPQVHKMVEAYQEAKNVLDKSDQSIFNATIGGKLEVFGRVNYGDIFPSALSPDEVKQLNEERAPTNIQAGTTLDASTNSNEAADEAETPQHNNYPKLLLFDITLIGNGTATGELKHNLMSGWPKDKVLQFFSTGLDRIGMADFSNIKNSLTSIDAALESIKEFNPEVILYRPVPDNMSLHDLAMQVIRHSKKPLLTWIMDDWPMRLQRESPDKYQIFDRDFRELIGRSALNLSIGEAMSNAFKNRYGVNFEPLANGVLPEDLFDKNRPVSSKDPVIVRYAGALAENMTLHSIARIARAIEQVGQSREILFEIRTKKIWQDKALKYFRGLQKTTFVIEQLSRDEYRNWLAEADILIIGYNFDPASVEYIQYSLANKMPECLASGAVTLAHGPAGVATIDYLKAHGCAAVVEEDSESALVHEIEKLASDQSYKLDLLQKAHLVLTEKHNLSRLRKEFKRLVNEARQSGSNSPDVEFPVISRDAHAHVDETKIVACLLSELPDSSLMIDVGAHYGTALAPFHQMDWKVLAFEPDPLNRKHLIRKYGESKNVIIDTRAVGEHSDTEVSFYTSPESTGISGMLAFHETHKLVDKVNVTTVKDIVAANSVDRVDFLKIDVEGYDFSVLKGIPWDSMSPDVIECEFEDAKTNLLGHSWRDICEYLVEKEYTVYVSEWHPIIRYGIRHDWLGLKCYPCELADSNAWGNLLAFKRDPGPVAIQEALSKVLTIENPEKIVTSTELEDTQDDTSDVNSTIGTAEKSTPVKTRSSKPYGKTNMRQLFSRRFSSYAYFAEWVQSKNLTVFRVGQFIMWILRFLKRHPGASFFGLVALGALLLTPLLIPQFAPYGNVFWAAAGLLLFSAISAIGVSFGNKKMIEFADREFQYRRTLRAEMLSELQTREAQMFARLEAQGKQQSELGEGLALQIQRQEALGATVDELRIQDETLAETQEQLNIRVEAQDQQQLKLGEGLVLQSQRQEALDDAVDELRIQDQTLAETQEQLNTRVEAQDQQQSELGEGLALQSQRQEALDAAVDELQQQDASMAETQEQLNTRVEEQSQQQSELGEGLTLQSQRQEVLEAVVDELRIQDQTLAETQEQLNIRVEAQDQQQLKLGEGLVLQSQRQEALDDAVDELRIQDQTLAETQEQLNTRVEAQDQQQSELGEGLALQSQRQEALDAAVDELQQQDASMAETQEQLNTRVEEQSQQQSELGEGLTLQSQRQEVLEAVVDELRIQDQTLAETQEQLNIRVEAQDQQQLKLGEGLVLQSQRQEALDDAVDELRIQDQTLAETQEQLNTRVEAQDQQQSELGEGLALQSQRHEALDAVVDELRVRDETLAETQEQLNTRVEEQSQQQSELGEGLALQSQRLEALDAAVDELQQQDASLVETQEQLNARIESQEQQQSEQSEALNRRYNHLIASTPIFNFSDYQTFNRRLAKTHVETLQQEWLRKLGLKVTPQSLAYLAQRICTLESASKGRLATTVEDAVLRVLVASAVKSKNLRILEIGTLFGIGLAMIHDHTNSRFDSVHLTAVDPLDGYYGNDSRDIVTSEAVDERTFRSNLASAGIPEQDYTLIKSMSTEDVAIESAMKPLHDVLIIDGDHSFAGVQADFVGYLPAVKRGGYIIFDDYGAPDWPDVKEFVDTTVRSHPNVALVGTSWRTAVFRVVRKSAATKQHEPDVRVIATGKRSGQEQD